METMQLLKYIADNKKFDMVTIGCHDTMSRIESIIFLIQVYSSPTIIWRTKVERDNSLLVY